MTFEIALTILVFAMTMVIILWRPKGINEAIPATIGAILIILFGYVSFDDILDILQKISGASITIISTLVMAIILESFGFFHWAAARLGKIAKGSGYRLYWFIQLLCFFMTLLFNNDGSILITTPILILLLKNLRLKPHQSIPYLISGAFIATAASTPIGVSNIVNLISLEIVDMSLYTQTTMMFIPATLGLAFMSTLMFYCIRKTLPVKLPPMRYDIEIVFFTKNFHPFKTGISVETKKQRTQFMMKILGFVLIIRCLLFVASYLSFPIELIAVSGSLILLLWRWYYLGKTPGDILKKTPWHIFIFAFSMYIMIYGLHNVGLTELLVQLCEPLVNQSLLNATFIMGGLVTIMSNFFNNHPALMIGTITLTEMQLNPITLKTIYLANIIGSDIGSLLLPIGTLASLIWLHILRQNKIVISWKKYLSYSVLVIPLTTFVTLLLLYYWIELVFR